MNLPLSKTSIINRLFYLFNIIILITLPSKLKADEFSWIDSLNSKVLEYSISIYDPDAFLKEILKDSVQIEKYIEVSERNKNYEALSFAYNMFGKNRLMQSDYSEAIEKFNKAYQVALSIDNEYLEALSLNMMGVVYRRKSAAKTALEYYTRALRTAEKSANSADYMLKSIAISNEGIGGLYRLLGQYQSAIMHYKYSLRYEERLGSLLGMAIDNHNIGKSFEFLGELDSAMFYHERSLEYNEKMHSKFGKAVCYNSMGKVALTKGNNQKAYNLLVPALQMSKSVGDSTYIVNSNLNLGWYHLSTDHADSADFYLSTAINIALRLGNKSAVRRGYELYAKLEEQKRNFPAALDYFKLSSIYNDSIINEKNHQYLTDLTILYDIEKKQRTIEKLQYNAKLSKKIQQSKNVVIIMLGFVAIVLIVLIFQKLQASKKNKVIQDQKENLFNMQLEVKALHNERLLAENKQKESEKELLEEKLTTNELARQNEIKAMQNEIDLKNRELAATAAYTIKKGESMRKFFDSIEEVKGQKKDVIDALNKLQKEIKSQMNPENDWENFSIHFEKVHPSFFRNLKSKHQNLTLNELRLCAYLLMNMSNKEIALLLYISTDAVQKAKYRLKKKFELDVEFSLYDYLIAL